MKFLARLFGSGRPPAAGKRTSTSHPSTTGHAPSSRQPAGPSGSRREMLRAVLRDTLRRHGIPEGWITAEMLTATSRNREPGLHWRLAIRHWDPRLPNLCVALQNSLITRLLGFDPLANQWLMGISWQFALADETACPPLPHPGLWTAPLREPVAPATEAAAAQSGDVIAGPVKIDDESGNVKADLQQLMAALDAQYQAGPAGAQGSAYATTEPARL